MITGSEEESRALMMNAAVRIVARHGFEGFTTKKWAYEAGVAEGSLYYHFKSKKDLLDETFFMIDDEITALYSDEDGVPEERGEIRGYAENLWKKHYRYLLDHPDRTKYYYRFRTSPRYTDEVQTEYQDDSKGVYRILEQMDKSLHLAERLPFHVLWCYVLDTTTSIAFRVITGGIKQSDETEKQLACLVLRGLEGLLDRAAEPAV